jgi:hypothetical protein
MWELRREGDSAEVFGLEHLLDSDVVYSLLQITLPKSGSIVSDVSFTRILRNLWGSFKMYWVPRVGREW